MCSIIRKHVKNVKLEFRDGDIQLVVIDDKSPVSHLPGKTTSKCIIYNGHIYSALRINRNRERGYDRIAKHK